MANCSNSAKTRFSSAAAIAYNREPATPEDAASVSTAPQPAPRRRFWKLLLRALAVLVLSIVLLVCGGIAWFYRLARNALPQVDGEIPVSGLSARVSVVRDPHGVPHIIAENAEDLFFAQGYVTAQDRLWQMDLSRRLADGTAAEVMGAAVLERDKEQRTIGMRLVAERSWAALSARDRSYFDAYARGVNAYIEAHRNGLPLEFRVLRYSPKPWTGVDSLLCGILMSEGLNHGLYETKLVREKILARLGPQLAADLYPNSSWRDHAPGIDAQAAAPKQTGFSQPDGRPRDDDFVSTRGAEFRLPPDDALVPGSNNWVVSGTHTLTGKPLLSNDMHLGLRIPNTWYEAQLEIRAQAGQPGFDVAGFTLPGLPFVLVGHNQRIAWGFTNLVPDVEDVFIENVWAGEYQTPDGWKPLEKRQEVIHVKGQPDVALEVMLTRHGPIITGLAPHEKRALALKWNVYDEPVTVPFFDIDAAQNWQEFRSALSRLTGPGQNIVYADVDGHIGYQAAGHIPIRRSGDGALPVNGADNSHEWTGYVPFDKLPSVYDPVSGIIATANGRITPEQYPYSISTQWGSPYRTERIYYLLNSKEKFAAADMLKFQTDTYSAFDRFCAERFVSAVKRSARASSRAREAAELMQNWNGWVSQELSAPTLVVQARQELLRLLLEPRLKAAGGKAEEEGLAWTDYHWFMSSVALENILTQQPPRWLPPSFASYDDLLTAALENVISQKEAPGSLASWKWGEYSPLTLQHPIFGKIPVLKRWSGPGIVAQSGDGYTVKQMGSNFGPSERMTVDLANLDASNFNIVTGQSGQLFSAYYMDQWQAWYQGSSFPMPFSDGAVIRAGGHELSLLPK
jgi:penicillin G amidase